MRAVEGAGDEDAGEAEFGDASWVVESDVEALVRAASRRRGDRGAESLLEGLARGDATGLGR